QQGAFVLLVFVGLRAKLARATRQVSRGDLAQAGLLPAEQRRTDALAPPLRQHAAADDVHDFNRHRRVPEHPPVGNGLAVHFDKDSITRRVAVDEMFEFAPYRAGTDGLFETVRLSAGTQDRRDKRVILFPAEMPDGHARHSRRSTAGRAVRRVLAYHSRIISSTADNLSPRLSC